MGKMKEIGGEVEQFEEGFGMKIISFLKKQEEFNKFKSQIDKTYGETWLNLVRKGRENW